MMWDLLGGLESKKRDRSKSPHPPLRRSPSPAMPLSYTQSAPPYYNPDPYGYGYSPTSPFYPPVSPPYGQFLGRDYSSAAAPGQLPGPSMQFQHVVHVIHHSEHHSKHKHKHKHHHSNSDAQSSSIPIPMPSPTVIMPSTSHQSGYTSSSQQEQRKPHFRLTTNPQTVTIDALASQFQKRAVLVKPSRKRINSQPALPTGYKIVHPNEDVAHSGHKHGYIQDPRNPNFRYSTCTGRRKALCIGINYLGQDHELRGCINDAKNVKRFLIDHGGYQSSDIVLLTDDASDPRLLPTRSNMIQAMKRLVRNAKRNDALFFHYSGHGGQTRDLDGDELDGFDEVIFPMDYATQGHIVDDELNDIMVQPLPKGCRLTALFDACHSGTVLDLSYMYSAHGRLKGMHISAKDWEKKATPADVISWSGCMDEQTSADTFQGGVAVGAMSYAFITALTTTKQQTYQDLLNNLRKILNPRYSQKPQLGSSHKIDTNLQFVF